MSMSKFALPKLILMLLLIALSSRADLSVKSFRLLEIDLDARTNYPLKDQNGEIAAIIKVVTNQKGFTFDGGMTGIVKTIEKPSEIWVYVPWGLKRLSIFHPHFGQLRDYFIPTTIEKACVYELVLLSGKVETTVVEEIVSQWLVINPYPENAAIYVDDEFKQTGVFTAKYKPGKYSYRVEAPLYHSEAGWLDVADSKVSIDVTLKPAFGYIAVNTLPESGAKVIIAGKVLPQLTPTKSEPLASGEYSVQVLREMYEPVTKKFLVVDGQTAVADFKMQPNFASLTITAPENAEIFLNNLQKAIGTWKGRISPGVYTIEARLDKHRSAKQDVELFSGDNKLITLKPTPIYGSVDVISNPVGAAISINGKEYGTTPNTIDKLLIGDYTIVLKMKDYSPIARIVKIEQGQTAIVNESLSEINKQSSADEQLISDNTPNNESTVANAENPDITITKTKSSFFFGLGITLPLLSFNGGEQVWDDVRYSFLVGYVNRFGPYIKVVTKLSDMEATYNTQRFLTDFPSSRFMTEPNTEDYRFNKYYNFTGGLMMNVSPVLLYAGIGKGKFSQIHQVNIFETTNSNNQVGTVNIEQFDQQGLSVEAGVLFRRNILGYNLNWTMINFKIHQIGIEVSLVF